MSNRKVFSLFLNVPIAMSGSRSSAGRLFQTRGPWTAKLRSPNFVLVRGTQSWPVCAERRWRRPERADIAWQYVCRYCKAMPLCAAFAPLLGDDDIGHNWNWSNASFCTVYKRSSVVVCNTDLCVGHMQRKVKSDATSQEIWLALVGWQSVTCNPPVRIISPQTCNNYEHSMITSQLARCQTQFQHRSLLTLPNHAYKLIWQYAANNKLQCYLGWCVVTGWGENNYIYYASVTDMYCQYWRRHYLFRLSVRDCACASRH